MTMKLLAFILNFATYVLCEDMNAIIKIDVTTKESKYICKTDKETYTFVEEAKMYLYINTNINSKIEVQEITCVIPNQVNKKMQRAKKDTFSMDGLTMPDWGGVWKCTVTLINQNSRPVVPCNSIKVHVRRNNAPVQIYVNSIQKSLEKPSIGADYDAEVVHYYNDGDGVEIRCTNIRSQNNQLKMEYSYFETLNGKIFPGNFKYHYPTGLRLGLTSKMNNTVAICHCYISTDNYTVGVKFLMNQTDEMEDIQLNGLTMRKEQSDHGNYTYYFGTHEHLLVSCVDLKTKTYSNLSFHDRPESYVVHQSANYSQRGSTHLTAKSATTIICEGKYRTKIVELKPKTDFVETKCVTYVGIWSTLLGSSPTMVHYEGDSFKVLYRAGEQFTITCSGYCYISAIVYNVELILGNKVYNRTDDSTPHDLLFVSGIDPVDYEKNFINCTVLDRPPAIESQPRRKGYAESSIQFVPYGPQVTTTAEPASTSTSTVAQTAQESKSIAAPTETPPEPVIPPWVMSLLIALATLILCYVSYIIYRRRRRMTAKEYNTPIVNYANLPHNGNGYTPSATRTPDCTYADPRDCAEEPKYTEPFRPTPALYATPIPKSERPKNGSGGHSETGYEEVGPNYAQVQNEVYTYPNSVYSGLDDSCGYAYVTASPNYAQVLPKSERRGEDKYINVFKGAYVNTNAVVNYAEPECLRPTVKRK